MDQEMKAPAPGDMVTIRLEPVGETVTVARGTPLREVLPSYGVEFPCGGRGLCDGCRVKVVAGELSLTAEQTEILTPEELEEGWRLMCRCRAEADVTLDVVQWDPVILGDHQAFEFTPGDGLAIAVDLGTTTLVAQLLDRETGRVLAVRSALNPQVGYGSDIMSRVEFALTPGGLQHLTTMIRDEIGELVARLFDLDEADARNVRRVVLVGNTVMHHLFCGLGVEPLSRVPFHPTEDGLQRFRASDLGWELPPDVEVEFLPSLGGFVGSDILAGILATRMYESDPLIGLLDLGTNGEIALGNRERIICASTAAGPAFEGGRIGMGMRATDGAISQVLYVDGELRCEVIGNAAPRGICGSGLVDAVSVALNWGWINRRGRIQNEERVLRLTPSVRITQHDIRELQLAKAAIASGIQSLLGRLGREMEDVSCLYLAGAFGNYISRKSALRIGLFSFPVDRVKPLGNTALRGAKLALFEDFVDREFNEIRKKVHHVSLASMPDFQELFAEATRFP